MITIRDLFKKAGESDLDKPIVIISENNTAWGYAEIDSFRSNIIVLSESTDELPFT